MNNGKFVISLDFELMWGVREKKNKDNYGSPILGVHSVMPKLLKAFRTHQIKATFSTVGFLFFENKQTLIQHLPVIRPEYKDPNLSPYKGYIETIGNDVQDDPYHFGWPLLQLIQQYPEQEIGTHTFSHYYCLEQGQSIEAFREDMKSAMAVAKQRDISLTSLIFPRNQFNEEYLNVCAELGITCYRGNEESWLYRAKSRKEESLLRRALRLVDTYINISGHNCYTDELLKSSYPVNIPSSRFLRPYSKKLQALESLRLRRICAGMTHAAKHKLTYHLWWHPHNFGVNQDENLAFLNKILLHYNKLNKAYAFESITMSDLAKQLK